MLGIFSAEKLKYALRVPLTLFYTGFFYYRTTQGGGGHIDPPLQNRAYIISKNCFIYFFLFIIIQWSIPNQFYNVIVFKFKKKKI